MFCQTAQQFKTLNHLFLQTAFMIIMHSYKFSKIESHFLLLFNSRDFKNSTFKKSNCAQYDEIISRKFDIKI